MQNSFIALNLCWTIIRIIVPEPIQQHRLILASASPRRKQLLEQIGLRFESCPVNIDESAQPDESPVQLVERLSDGKAVECLRRLDAPIGHICLGADTVIDLDGAILGKPTSAQNAIDMLLAMADREHTVHTGVSLRCGPKLQRHSCVVSTIVRFGKISASQAHDYWSTGEPVDKASGYAIQGAGAQFVEHLSGSYSNVVGLPLYETMQLLRTAAPSLIQRVQAG